MPRLTDLVIRRRDFQWIIGCLGILSNQRKRIQGYGDGDGGIYACLVAHFVFLMAGIGDVGVEGCVFVTGGCVVGSAFAVLGCFGVDTVFVLGVFSRIAEGGGVGYGTGV